jgi:hypothetical protein
VGGNKFSLVNLDKLMDVVAQGIGAIAKPWMIKRTARAEAVRMKILAAAQNEIDRDKRLLQEAETSHQKQLTVGDIEDIDLEVIDHRIEQRVTHREARRQLNVEAISLRAADEILILAEASAEPVDEDWIARFFTAAQEVSNPELQAMWSRLLAQEVAQPGRVSLRTLDALRSLSPTEARLFNDVARYVATVVDGPVFLPRLRPIIGYSRLLQDCGLISVKTHFTKQAWGEVFVWNHAGLELQFEVPASRNVGSYDVQVYPLTTAGLDIVRIAGLPEDPCIEMLVALSETWGGDRFHITVRDHDKCVSLSEFIDATQTFEAEES